VQSQKGVGLFFMIRWKNVVTFHSIEWVQQYVARNLKEFI
jgi:hypothetical protein